MDISLSGLTIDPIAASDIPRGDASRAVRADRVLLSLGSWHRSYDGVAVPFLLDGIYSATLAALLDGTAFDFFCLDDTDGGRVFPAGPGRVRVRLSDGEEHELSGLSVLRAVFGAMLEVAEFLTANGYPEGAAILLRELTQRAPPQGLGWATD